MKTTQENLLKIKSWLFFKSNNITISTCTYSWQYISSIFTVRVIVRVNENLDVNIKKFKTRLLIQNTHGWIFQSFLTFELLWWLIKIFMQTSRKSKTKVPVQNTVAFITIRNYLYKICLYDMQIKQHYYIYLYILVAEHIKRNYSMTHREG